MIPRGLRLEIPVAAAMFFVAATGLRARAADGNGGADGGAAMSRAQAQQLLERGNERFRAGDFAEALRTYRAAHDAFPSPKLLFNIGRCEESLGQRTRAINDLRAFVAGAPDADPDVRAEAERRVTALARALALVDLSALPAHAAVTVDGQAVGLTPIDQPVWVEPGAHRISVERAGQPLWITTIDGAAGATVAVALPSGPLADPDGHGAGHDGALITRPPPANVPSGSRWWIWAGLGLVLAGVVTTLVVIKVYECPATQCH